MFTSKNLFKFIGRNAITAIIVLFFTLLAIYFLEKQIIKITDSVVLNHKLKVELTKRTELLTVIEKDSKIVGNNDLLIDNAFVPSNNISKFINALDGLTSGKQILQTYRFETPEPTTLSGSYPLSTIIYSNNLTTNIQNISSYLKSFEKLPYFTKITSLSISSQDRNGWVGPSIMSIRAVLITKTIQ